MLRSQQTSTGSHKLMPTSTLSSPRVSFFICPVPICKRNNKILVCRFPHYAKAFGVSKEDLQSFHSIDRDVFSRLVTELDHNCDRAMQVMAMWLWLEEELGSPSLVLSVNSMPGYVLNAAFEEADMVLACIKSENSPPETPVTYSLITEEVKLEFLYENREYAMNGITRTLTEVCSRAFEDIAKQFQPNGCVKVTPLIRHGLHRGFRSSLGLKGVGPRAFCKETNVQVFVQSVPQPLQASRDIQDRPPSPKNPTEDLSLDAETLFLTFSKGYPLTEKELQTFFLRTYGDVVQDIFMQEKRSGTEPLYARAVFHSPDNIATIMEGQERIRFFVNGKHVWCRRFVSRSKNRSV
ncbi:hypothetical protein ACHQM5_021772 [Ranunculus cassubicifolius]